MSDPLGFLFSFGAGPYLAYVYPMRRKDGPFRMVVTAETGAESTFVGLTSAGRCVESAVTFLGSQGVQVPIQVVRDWYAKAEEFDRPTEIDKTGDWS